jgi:hypothetical protein
MNTKEQVNEWDKILDEYEKGIGLGTYRADAFPEEELNNYFQMSRDELEKTTPEVCGEIAYRLGQFAFHVQRSINRELSRLNWADETIKETIADELNNYKGYGYIEKAAQAIKNNEKATALNKIKKYAKQRSDRLQYLANSIKHLSDIMLSIQKAKVKHGSQ